MAQSPVPIARSREFLDILRQTVLQQERAVELYRSLVAISDLAASLNMAQEVAELESCLADTFRELMPAESARICSLSDSCYHRTRLSGPDVPGEEGTFPVSEGLMGRVLASGTPLWVGDMLNSNLAVGSASASVEVLPRSLIIVPFFAMGKVAGGLEIISSRPNRFDEMDYNLVLMIATHLSCSIENIFTRQELAAANDRLRQKDQHLEELNQQLRELAHRDEVTGLFNKRRLMEQLEAEIARARRYGEIVSCLMLDIDHFKRVNDTLGHPAGDEALRQFGALIRRNLRVTDFVARYGGEEFTILLPRTDRAGAFRVSETLRSAVNSNLFVLPGGSVHLTISIGIASCTKFDQLDGQKVILRADAALYRAKHLGRDCACSADET